MCHQGLFCFMTLCVVTLLFTQDAEIIRTRDSQLLSGCDVVVDVGGEYDPQRHRYDHHQRSFGESMHSLKPDKPWQTKLSSAGLVYCHFGSQILANQLGLKDEDPVVRVLYDKLYENFVEEIDAIDNGISQWEGEPSYAMTTNVSARVGYLNPRWNDKEQDTEAGFQKAMELVGKEFLDRLDYYYRAWLPARTLVEEAIQQRFEGGCPWKEHLFTLEQEMDVKKPLKFILYTDLGGQWRVQCVPAGLRTFQNRLSLLEEWRGLRDEELSEVSGIPGCVFVHSSGFIGGNHTKEGALEMARKTLAQKTDTN
ncbi:hypothetical protein JD844_010879 [Phrynosoma platyrhinos]|uniref:MYG1 protein n=1 Tax=Phrynosoma platyrhinos TaxID=52577 RepID=A0ABQ7TIB2_PHRPL|nr:hypothetical protein JD844_010879 [Phrynosoma platyrhinos]